MLRVFHDNTVVFLSHREPNKLINLEWNKKIIPHLRWVDGVDGFDLAHQTVGMISNTEYTTVIDGDVAVHQYFVDEYDLVFDPAVVQNNVISFSSHNRINSLRYGNGGVKVWPTSVLRTIACHELCSTESTDFYHHVKYLQQPLTIADTIQNGSAVQAFTAGFREGFKLFDVKFNASNNTQNKLRLITWLNVGCDVEYGAWACVGSRLGVLLADALRGQQSIMFGNFTISQTTINNLQEVATIFNTLPSDYELAWVEICNIFPLWKHIFQSYDLPVLSFSEDVSILGRKMAMYVIRGQHDNIV